MSRGTDALVAYGYTEEGDNYIKYRQGVPREKYTKVEDGFLRFTREDGQWKPIPHSVGSKGQGLNGLDFNRDEHKEFYNWVYPDEELGWIYEEGLKAQQAERERVLIEKASNG